MAFCFTGWLRVVASKLLAGWRFLIAIGLESVWEVIENSAIVIDRYREATVSLGYTGDTVINSMADIAACGIGFWVVWKPGWKKGLLVFILVELVLLWWIRDGLLLNIIMLLYRIDVIREWQSALQ